MTRKHARFARSRSAVGKLALAESLETRRLLAVFTVTSTADDGAGSLRQAIIDSNNASTADEITFSLPGGPQTISLSSALPAISVGSGGLTITGPGANLLTVRRNPGAATDFKILDNLSPSFTLTGMTLTGGTDPGANGGAISTTGTNLFDGVNITGNIAAEGGGVNVNAGGFLTVRNSTISGNTAADDGAGVYFYNGGSLVLENSTVSGNQALGDDGGGIYFYGTASATPPSGFIPSTLLVRNSTIASNTANDGGGGIDLHTFTGTLLVQNTTITGNTANDSAAGGGGGISKSQAGGTITIVSSIVSGNTNAFEPDIRSNTTQVNANFSAIGSNAGFTLSPSSGQNLPFGTNLLLGAPGNNGGPTQTIAPAANSPVVNAGLNPSGAADDQRGPGFARISGAAADIGAFEIQNQISGVANASNVTTAGATNYQFTVTYTDDTAVNASSIGTNDVTVNGPGGFSATPFFAFVDINTNGTPRVATYNITPPGGSWNTTDNGLYTINQNAGTVLDEHGNFVGTGAIGTFNVNIVLPQNFIVTNADDDGPGSLRDAITLANANSPAADTITFGGVFTAPQTMSLLTALPLITDSLTITGTSARNLIIRRDPAAVTDFGVLSSIAPVLNLSNVTLHGGRSAGNGGGLAIEGMAPNVTLSSVIISGNSAAGRGAGIRLGEGAFLTVRNSTISGNTAANNGGGIYFYDGGSLVLENSTVSGNATGAAGGGIYFFGAASATPPSGFIPSTVLVRNSTITSNSAAASGGGIRSTSFVGTLLVQNSTITGNSSGNAGGGINSLGGTVTSASSIVSGNRGGTNADIFAGNPVNANFSAIGLSAGFTLSGSSGNNLPFGTNLRLSPLGNYGGPTQTMMAGIGSPAINAGFNFTGPFDQRGFDRVGADGVPDIGACETQGYIAVMNADDSGPGSLRAAIDAANLSSFANDIAFSNFFNTPRTISLLTALPQITESVNIFGPGASLLTVNRAGGAPDFGIFSSTATTLNIFGLTATGGRVDGIQGSGGGALFVGGVAPNATLDSVNFSGNSITGEGGGGAVHVVTGGFLTVRNSTISGNTATGEASDGGGIYFYTDGSLVLENSTVSGNAQSGGTDGEAGGIYFYGTANANPPLGFVPGALLVRNSTIANNTTTNDSGGIRINGFAGTLLVQNSTITGNSAAAGRFGGGIDMETGTGTITITNSIVSGNNGSGAPDIASDGTVIVGFSAVGSNTGFTLTDLGGNLAFGANLLLGGLGNNGGPTPTRLPQTGSPLINAGSNALVSAGAIGDQRGSGFARIRGSSVDIGAVETGTPFAVQPGFEFETQLAVSYSFSEDVSASLQTSDVVATNLGNSAVAPVISVQYVGGMNIGRFRFSSTLPDGNYRAVLSAAGVTNGGGVPLGESITLDFFVLAGDANRDRVVNIGDFSILGANFNQPGTFSQGDFNYNGTVEIGDFSILGSRFNTSLPAAGDLPRGTVEPASRPVPHAQIRMFSNRLVGDGGIDELL